MIARRLPGTCRQCGQPVELAVNEAEWHQDGLGVPFVTHRTGWLDPGSGQPHYCRPER